MSNSEHHDEEVRAALIRLNDALCSWERATGRQCVLILKEEGGFVHRSVNGKPVDSDYLDDRDLWNLVED